MKIIPKPNHITLYESKCFFDEEMYEEKIVSGLNEDEYILEATFSGGVTLRAGSQQGLYYGRCTFRQIRAQYADVFPSFRIEDKPVFKYRSFLIDCSRHFFSVEELKRVIDAMALLKFNVFHWHLTDDQGWRMECESYPELHNLASQRLGNKLGRNTDTTPYGGYYTAEQMKEIVSFCSERYITVVPELDVPGHCSALLSVMPELSCWGSKTSVKSDKGIFKEVLCPGKEQTYDVLKDIFRQMFDIFPGGYYHIGGDEAPTDRWHECADCRRVMKSEGIESFDDYRIYFLNRVASFLKENGKRAIVWNDCLSGHGLDSNIIVQHWKEGKSGNSATVSRANAGRSVILSPYSRYYMDLPYCVTPLKKVFSYTASVKGFDLRGRESVLGVETCVWTEFIRDGRRLQQMMFPRVLAVAQTAWCGDTAGKSYFEFVNSLEPVLKLLSEQGISVMKRFKWDSPLFVRLVDTVKFLIKNQIISGVLKPPGKEKEYKGHE